MKKKNMSVRSAEVANKQHLEGVMKIAKLEVECQRLCGLVRKKLPGPAALAQMKLEVDSLGRDYGETRVKRSQVKPPISSPQSPHFSSLPDFSLDNIQKYQKENEFLTERLLGMEEETKMLKEAFC
ncbi:filament-like plant protein 4 [Tanacetum coccineum]